MTDTEHLIAAQDLPVGQNWFVEERRTMIERRYQIVCLDHFANALGKENFGAAEFRPTNRYCQIGCRCYEQDAAQDNAKLKVVVRVPYIGANVFTGACESWFLSSGGGAHILSPDSAAAAIIAPEAAL